MILSISALLCLLGVYLVLAGFREFTHWCCQNWANPLLELADQRWPVKLVYHINKWSVQFINSTIVASFMVGAWVVFELVRILQSLA